MVKLSEIKPELYTGEWSLKSGGQVASFTGEMDTVYKCSKRMPCKGHNIPEYHKNTTNLEITPSLRLEGTLANPPDEITHSSGIKDMGQLMNV